MTSRKRNCVNTGDLYDVASTLSDGQVDTGFEGRDSNHIREVAIRAIKPGNLREDRTVILMGRLSLTIADHKLHFKQKSCCSVAGRSRSQVGLSCRSR